MEPLTLKAREPAKEDIECWDDDDDLQGIDDLHFRHASTTTIGSTNASYHRDSISSRISTRSDRESSAGGDEEWQVSLPDDETSTTNAIASAKSAGIPIPNNVPTSALLGGTIKRLGGRRLKRVLGDDWDEDLELPKMEKGGLKLKKQETKDFSDALRQFSAEFPSSPSPTKPAGGMTFMQRMESARKAKGGNQALDKFKDDDDDDFFGDVPTIKVAKNRSQQKALEIATPASKLSRDTEDLENDIEFPPNGEPLKLSTRKEQPKTPASQQDDFDLEWAEGSLGTRFGGTRREARSNPSSAFSPSASSCLISESEDEGLEGLVLPEGPLKFDEVLKKRLENVSPDDAEPSPREPVKQPTAPRDDFFTGIDIGDGDVFDSKKLTLNRNVKLNAKRQTSPKRTATTLTFTNKSQPGITRIPKPPAPERSSNDRHRTPLESVSETGGPVPGYRRSGSRIGGHSAHSSISAIPTPSTPSSHSAAPSTPSRRGLNTKSSRDNLRGETTNPTQYLKAKRSQPIMPSQSPARSQPGYPRPPSRSEFGHRQGLVSRPKTPIDRSGAESSLASARKPPVPFLPAGMSHAQSHHISAKSSRYGNRPTSSDSNENVPLNRPVSRLSNVHRPTTPTGRRDVAPESLAREAASKRTLTKPTRRRQFGDGNELEVFDDLPTSASTESKFVKQPIARGAPKSVQMRSKLGLSHLNSSSSTIESSTASAVPPSTPLSPVKQDFTPRFARDTNASRLAREQRIGSVGAALHTAPSLPTVRESGPLNPISTNWKTRIDLTSNSKAVSSPRRRGKALPQKPKLIKPMGDGHNHIKTLKGMQWNPTLFRWEGNENALAPFDVPITPQSPTSKGKAAPALIANVGATKGVQVVGGMVFDPQRMCWLKMGPTGHPSTQHQKSGSSNPMSPDTVEEEDPFAGLEDLVENKERQSMGGKNEEVVGGKPGMVDDEWLVGEEFDVGPAFVQRQRMEEEKWRRKVEGWVGEVRKEEGDWRWGIRREVEVLPGGMGGF